MVLNPDNYSKLALILQFYMYWNIERNIENYNLREKKRNLSLIFTFF